MPVEVMMENGNSEVRVATSGDWRGVVKWRSVDLTQGEIKQVRKSLQLEAKEIEKMG